MRQLILTTFVLVFATACTGLPKNVQPVENFALDRYLGTWYEIARLDHRFERGLKNVTANYTMRDDGGVKVTNRGFSIRKNEWLEASGKAYFVGDSNKGHLKVSFFGPLYGTYAVFELDETEYQYAFVSGYSTKYLWLLARTTSISSEIMDEFKQRATELDFNLDDLIIVDHSAVQ